MANRCNSSGWDHIMENGQHYTYLLLPPSMYSTPYQQIMPSIGLTVSSGIYRSQVDLYLLGNGLAVFNSS